MSISKRKLYIDMDGVIISTVERIVEMYNEDFRYYKKFVPVNWWEVNTWEFAECKCATPEYINTYFNQPRFFSGVKEMFFVKDILKELSGEYDIVVVTSGFRPNLAQKEKWIKDNLPFCEFIGVNMKKHKDKSHVDMKGGIFIDDSYSNLSTSNADFKICFGDVFSWNEKWDGTRCYNWIDVKEMIS